MGKTITKSFPKGFIRLVDTEKIQKGIADYVSDALFEPRLKTALRVAKQPILEELLKSFKKTTAWRGINGEFELDEERDVQAHLGLTDELAKQSLLEMEEGLRQTFKVRRIIGLDERGKIASGYSSFRFVFNLSSKTLSDAIFESVSNPSYISICGKDEEARAINWLAGLLHQESLFYHAEIVLEKDGQASIPTGDGSELTIDRETRSGRAFMRGGGTWGIGSYGYFAPISNFSFVVDALTRKSFLERVKKIMVETISNQFTGNDIPF